MKPFRFIAVALVLLHCSKLAFCQAESTSLGQPFAIRIPGLLTAAMSPDEKHLAALVRNTATTQVQVWDISSGSKAQSLGLTDARPGRGERQPSTHIQYTDDGQLLVADASGDVVYVLRTSDLSQVRTIKMSTSNVSAFEVSPAGHRVAVQESTGVRVYDLDSGEQVRSWSINLSPEFQSTSLLRVHPQFSSAGLAWHENGKTLAVSVADNPPCLRGGGTIYIFDLSSEKLAKSFRTSVLPSAIAFGSGNDLYIASNTCGGYFSHWTLELPVIDITSGRESGKIPATKVGFRKYISVSANRQFLLAYADREKTTIGGGEDTLKVENAQWQIWGLTNRKLIEILPAIVQTWNCQLLSSSGRLVYGSRGDDVFVFSLPIATN